MAKHYVSDKNHPLVKAMQDSNLTKTDVCKALNVTRETLGRYMQDYRLMDLGQLLILSGLFGLPVEELVYVLVRNKPRLNKAGKWYLENIRNKDGER